MRKAVMRKAMRGFTVIELIVVLAALALLLSIVAPRYIGSIDRARDAALHHNLMQMRDAIDKFKADRGRPPVTLDELVALRYLRSIPTDPVTQRTDTWVLIPQPSIATGVGTASSGIADVRSGAQGQAEDGTTYGAW